MKQNNHILKQEQTDKKQKEEYDCIQDLYKEAVTSLNIPIEELKEPMDEETFDKKTRINYLGRSL